MKSVNILIVDGEKNAAIALARDLNCYHYQVSGIVSSGKKAIEKVAKNPPDLIIMDIMLQGDIDGVTTSKRIQADRDIPIIYLTSCRDRSTLKRARKTNPKGYLIKPYNPKDLYAMIQDIFPDANFLKSGVKKVERKAKLATYKIKRIAHKNFNLPSLKSYKNKTKREEYRNSLASLSPQDSQIITQLKQEGVYTTSFTELRFPYTKRLIKELIILHPHLYTLSHLKNWRASIPSHRKFLHTKILLWGLGERLLDIVENYIGLPILFSGVDLRRDIANAPLTDARNWHLDIDDERMIKIIIYLNNVGESGGPFEYIPKSLTPKITNYFNYKSGFISEDAIAKVVSPQQWRICTAKAGSIVITDPCSVFHRAKPAAKNRYSMTFCYTSRTPNINLSQFKLSPQEWQRITPHLNNRQIACLPKDKSFLPVQV